MTITPKSKGFVLIAPASSNTISQFSNGIVSGPLVDISACLALGNIPVYLAPASEMVEDPRVQLSMIDNANHQPLITRIIPSRLGKLPGERSGRGRLAPANEIAQSIYYWSALDYLVEKLESPITEDNVNISLPSAPLIRIKKSTNIV